MWNGGSNYSNGNSFVMMAADDPKIATMAALFRRQVPAVRV